MKKNEMNEDKNSQGAKSDEDVRSQQAKDQDSDDISVTAEKTEMYDEVEFEEVNEDLSAQAGGEAAIKKLREKVKKLEAEKKEYLDLSQRTRADYMNFKKEVESNRALDRKFATRNLIGELLPVLDAYDMAQANKASWEAVDQNWRVGVEYIFNQLKGVLEKEGVTQFGSLGERFNPMLHESMEHVSVDDESQDGTIVQVLQKGYKIADTILRPARVKTGEWKK